MGIGMSVPKVSLPKLGGKGRKPAKGKKPAKKTKRAPAKRRGAARSKRSPYEDEPEEFANWAMAMSPAAYEAVAARPKLASRRTSPYEDDMDEEYEDDTDEEYEDDTDEESYVARHQEYTPADFSSVATPINFSVLLMVVLFLLLVLSRR